MFNPTQTQVRTFFFEVFEKGQQSHPLTALEQIAYDIIRAHREYHSILANKVKYINYTWHVNSGEINPFLHMSLHLALNEQLSINQPFGICELYQKLCEKTKDSHVAQHLIIECLNETIYNSQLYNLPFDSNSYLNCIGSKTKI